MVGEDEWLIVQKKPDDGLKPISRRKSSKPRKPTRYGRSEPLQRRQRSKTRLA
jgi:hypothetical protein